MKIRKRLRFREDRRDVLVAYILLISPLGWFGAHKLYLNQPLWAIIYFCTGGLFGLGWIYDLLTIPAQVERTNALLAYRGSPVEEIAATYHHVVEDENIIEADYEYIKKSERQASGRMDTKNRPEKSLDARIIEFAEKAELHQVTLKDLIKAGIPLEDGKKALEKLAREGVCEEVTMDGTKVYCF